MTHLLDPAAATVPQPTGTARCSTRSTGGDRTGRDRTSPLEGDVRCDVCIVGGGYTGLWTAHFLQARGTLAGHARDRGRVRRAPARRVTTTASSRRRSDTASTPSSGDSGSSAPRPRTRPSDARSSSCGGSAASTSRRRVRARRLLPASPPTMRSAVGWTPTSRSPSEMGVRYEVLEAADARERIDSPVVHGALKTPGALVNPHRLVRGLARVVTRSGRPHPRADARAGARAA